MSKQTKMENQEKAFIVVSLIVIGFGVLFLAALISTLYLLVTSLF